MPIIGAGFEEQDRSHEVERVDVDVFLNILVPLEGFTKLLDLVHALDNACGEIPELDPVFAVDFLHWGRYRATDFEVGNTGGIEVLTPVLCVEIRFLGVAAADEVPDEVAEWRVIEFPPEFDFLVEEAIEVAPAGELDGGCVRGGGLHDNLTGFLAAAGPSRDLHQELKCAFRRPEILHVEGLIGVDERDQGYIGKIEPFGYHLSADEDVDATGAEVGEDGSEEVTFVHRIRVDSADFCPGEYGLDHIFNFLGAESFSMDFCGLALGTAGRSGYLVSGEMALEDIATAMVGERDAAFLG